MLRGIALTVGLLAALPAMAGEMSADEARRFVIGKMFSYTCFEGTRGQGRVYADGSVVGSIQFQGAGPVRYAHAAGRHAAGQGRVGLRLAARLADRALLQSRAHRATTASAARSRGWALPIASSRATADARSCAQRASHEALRSRWPAAVAHRRQQ